MKNLMKVVLLVSATLMLASCGSTPKAEFLNSPTLIPTSNVPKVATPDSLNIPTSSMIKQPNSKTATAVKIFNIFS